MSDLQLFRVEVTQTWTATGTALVMATSQMEAEHVARRMVEIDHLDAEFDDSKEWATEEPIETVNNMTVREADEYWLLIPDPKHKGQWLEVEPKEFRDSFTTELLASARLAAKERGNGQITLMEVE